MLCDLHFHANISHKRKHVRDRRMRAIARHFETNRLDYVASTEHAYKNPLDAYLRLAEITQGKHTRIIPGVEEVSAEGIDMIFLFRDEHDYRQGLQSLRTFFWSVGDVAQISKDINAITIVPHPFHLGSTSAGRTLPLSGYHSLLRNADYVEIHNGSALGMTHGIANSWISGLVPRTATRLGYTLDLPQHLRGETLGWSVGSDAHYPGEQYIVGTTSRSLAAGEHVFDLLKQRIRFQQYTLQPFNNKMYKNCFKILRDFQGICREGTKKRYKKNLARARHLFRF